MVRDHLRKSPANISTITDLVGYIEREKDISCLQSITSDMSMADMRKCADVLKGDKNPPTPPLSYSSSARSAHHSDTALDVEKDTLLPFEICVPNSTAFSRPVVIGSFVPHEHNFITESKVWENSFPQNERHEVELEWAEPANPTNNRRRGTALFHVVQTTPNGCDIALGTACQRSSGHADADSVARDSEPNQEEELDDHAIDLTGKLIAATVAATVRHLNLNRQQRNNNRRPVP
ncbi:hypothetical protein PspLS_03404 [Pyricularia sp. CBS 133598]|nr:hypothetical protein PspLS_03404 [Pyricularia sp. CBS 133598]